MANNNNNANNININMSMTMAQYALWTMGRVTQVTSRRNNPAGHGVILHVWWRPATSHAGCWRGQLDVLITDQPQFAAPTHTTNWGGAHPFGADDRGRIA